MSNILEVNKLGIDFGGLTAVNNFSMQIGENEIVGLIGPNGAGKTTVFNLLTKVHKQNRGEILLNEIDTSKFDTVQISKAGIARTFQNIRLFNELSVLDNVLAGMHNTLNYSFFDLLFRLGKFHIAEKEAKDKAIELLKLLDLNDYIDSKAKNLPYGAQRKLEIARALATNPKLLLLDEPAAGMNPQETEELMKTIRFVRDKFNISILLIEHDMNLVMNICERIYVLNYGTLLAKGSPDEIKNNKEVIKAYLGD